MRVWSLLFCLWAALGFSDATTFYTVGISSEDIYRVDLTDGSYSIVNTSSLAGISGSVALANDQTAYVAASNLVQKVDLTTGAVSLVANLGSGTLSGIALANATTAYVVNTDHDTISRVDLTNGDVSSVPLTSSLLSGQFPVDLALDLSLKNPTLAYTLGFDDNVYRIDLTNGNVSIATSSPITGVGLSSISLANNETAYVTGEGDDNVYRIDLITGTHTKVTPSSFGLELNGIRLINDHEAVVVGSSGNNNVYLVNLTNGSHSLVTPSEITGAELSSGAAVLQIGTSGLHGNDLTFAKYLNENGSPFVLQLFALQSDIAKALEIGAPTRNAISTFTAGNTQLAFGQILSNHLCQKRPFQEPRGSSEITPTVVTPDQEIPPAQQSNLEELLSDASDSMSPVEPTLETCRQERPYSVWFSPFGEYTHEKTQRQTPAFSGGTGGFVAGFDWQRPDRCLSLLGAAAAYGYTHVSERESAGYANINQGALGIYSELKRASWWCDLGLWGGMYHTKNIRHIDLPGVVGASARASINGWQLAPHLEFGYDYDQNWLRFEPFEMLDWVVSWERGFHEQGAGILNMGQDGRTSALLRNEVGIRFIEMLSYGWGTVAFREKGSYGYLKTFNVGTITSFLLGAPGSFTITTLSGAQNLGIVEFEVLFTPKNKKYPYGSINYQGEFGSIYQSHRAIATVGLDF